MLMPIAIVALAAAYSCGKSKSEGVSGATESPADVTASVDKATANPGDIITFTLTADYGPDVRVELPEMSDKFKDFRIVNSGNVEPMRKKGRSKIERWYKLQADVAGSYVIEPIDVNYRLPDGKQDVIKTAKIFIEIESLLGQEGAAQDIRDIKPPLAVLPSYKRFVTPAAVFAAIGAAAVLALSLYRRYMRKKAAARIARKPAHEEAMDALERLLMRRLVEHGRIQEFYFEISGILRRYMEARFGAPAIDYTTEEILCWADERDGLIRGEMKPVLTEFLVETDMVKFARHVPRVNEIKKVIQHLTLFVGKTAQSVEQEGSPLGGGKELHEHVSV
jgi:hypothetical protein